MCYFYGKLLQLCKYFCSICYYAIIKMNSYNNAKNIDFVLKAILLCSNVFLGSDSRITTSYIDQKNLWQYMESCTRRGVWLSEIMMILQDRRKLNNYRKYWPAINPFFYGWWPGSKFQQHKLKILSWLNP